jgi:hypothetical protein
VVCKGDALFAKLKYLVLTEKSPASQAFRRSYQTSSQAFGGKGLTGIE